jgi:hypothetical protein
VHAENYGHAKTLLRAFACGLRGKNTARAPCVCLAILPIFARRQHVEARTAGCKRAFRYNMKIKIHVVPIGYMQKYLGKHCLNFLMLLFWRYVA